MKKIDFAFFFILCSANPFSGQTNDDERRTANTDRERKAQREMLDRLENQKAPIPKIKGFYGKLTKEQKKRVKPSEEDYSKYKQFLESPRTGIVKIIPNPKCDVRVVNASDSRCVGALPISGMGSRYSFVEETHSNFLKSDISLSENSFSVGFNPNLSGVIVDLGDTNINLINLNTEEIRFLMSFSAVTRYSEIPKQRQQLEKGLESAGKGYATKTLAKLNATYALRSINYYKIRYYRLVDFYDDIILVFKIINIDSEGGVTLIWRELKKKSNIKL